MVSSHPDSLAMSKKSKSLKKKPEDDVALSLLKEEQTKLAALKEEELVQHEIASKIMELYHHSTRRHSTLTERERVLSQHAGQLLNGLQREEAVASKVSGTIRRIRHVRKQLLARITTPRWEVPHHYHMTCCEHILGHAQPHVMEVGEMLPGHLRLFSFAKRNILFTKSLIFALARAKQERKNASEKIKEVYRDLRSTRAQLKENDKLLTEIRKKSHLLPKKSPPPSPTPRFSSISASSSTSSSPPNRSNGPRRSEVKGEKAATSPYRRHSDQMIMAAARSKSVKTRYFSALNLPVEKIEEQLEDVIKRDKDGVAVEEKEWKQMKKLLEDLEKNTTKKNIMQAELVFIQNRRSRIGLPPPSPPLAPEKKVVESKLELPPASKRDSLISPSSSSSSSISSSSAQVDEQKLSHDLDRILSSRTPTTQASKSTPTTEMGSVSRILEQKRMLASSGAPQLSSHATTTSRTKPTTTPPMPLSSSPSSSSPFAASSPSPSSPSSFLSVSASPPTPIIKNKKANSSSFEDSEFPEEEEGHENGPRPLPFKPGSPL